MFNAKDERGAFFIVTARVGYTNPSRRANDRSWTSPLSSVCTRPILRSMSRSFGSDPSSDSEAASAARTRATARAISIRHFDPSTMKGKRFDPFLRSSSSATIAPGSADAPVSPIQAPGVEPPIELVPPTPLDGSDDEEKKRTAPEPPPSAIGGRSASGGPRGPPSAPNRGKGSGRDRSFSIVSLSQAVGDDECGICFEQLVIGVEDDETAEVRYLTNSSMVRRDY